MGSRKIFFFFFICLGEEKVQVILTQINCRPGCTVGCPTRKIQFDFHGSPSRLWNFKLLLDCRKKNQPDLISDLQGVFKDFTFLLFIWKFKFLDFEFFSCVWLIQCQLRPKILIFIKRTGMTVKFLRTIWRSEI
jgi:hypothetical protein